MGHFGFKCNKTAYLSSILPSDYISVIQDFSQDASKDFENLHTYYISVIPGLYPAGFSMDEGFYFENLPQLLLTATQVSYIVNLLKLLSTRAILNSVEQSCASYTTKKISLLTVLGFSLAGSLWSLNSMTPVWRLTALKENHQCSKHSKFIFRR
jgi:hypothetical protein